MIKKCSFFNLGFKSLNLFQPPSPYTQYDNIIAITATTAARTIRYRRVFVLIYFCANNSFVCLMYKSCNDYYVCINIM